MSRFLFAFVLLASLGARAQFTLTPSNASLAVQQDGTCRGHIEYIITEAGVVDEAGAPIVETGSIEIKTACTRLTTITSTETFDTSGGKLTISAARASITKTTVDKDGAGPRVAGDCDIVVTADATIRKTTREVRREKASHSCTPLTTVISNACWVARGSWHESAPFPAGIAKCP